MKDIVAKELMIPIANYVSVKKEDRLAELKTDVFRETVRFSAVNKDFYKADFWVNEWISYDARDLTAKVSKAQVYLRFPDKRGEGLTILSELYKKYPDVKMVSEEYLKAKAFLGQSLQ